MRPSIRQVNVRKECSHAAARIALVIGSAALSFSASAPALARSAATGHRACHTRPAHSQGCHSSSQRRHGGHPRTSASSHHTPKPHHSAASHTRLHAPKPTRARTEAASPTPTPAASIASTLATACQNTEITPEASNIGLVRETILCLINRVRAEHNEAPLVTNPDLERAANEHSQELVELDYFAHVSPSGLTPVQRIRETGYIPGPEFGYVIGENLAWGTLNLSTPQSIVSAWVASPGHLANILEAQYKETGIGVVAAVPPSLGNGQAGATYAQEFGVILE
jgi:uncharacterized protein YkwD